MFSSAASPDDSTQLSPPARKIPIIVVPGIMGTRLAEPGGDHKLAWNPTGGGITGRAPGEMAADPERLANVAAPLSPDEWSWAQGYPFDRMVKASWIPNFYNLIPDYYDDLCFALREELGVALKPMGFEPRVYACGYDWRLGNDIAATRLQKVVAAARDECDQELAILVAHSQGGLVSRYFCRKLGGESAVRALFLIGSPSLGAPQVYARMKRGIIGSADGKEMWFLRTYMGLNDGESKDLLRAFPSMYQLLPNKLFTQQAIAVPGHEPRLWLEFDRSQSGYPYTRDSAIGDPGAPAPLADCTSFFPAIYEDIYAGFGEQTASRLDYVGYAEDAATFHDALTVGNLAYMHPTTYCIACLDLPTPALADLPVYGQITAQGNDYVYTLNKTFFGNPIEAPLELVDGPGDSAVPEISCNPPASLLTTPFTPFGATYPPIRGVAHGDLPNDPDVIKMIVEEIPRIVVTENVEDDIGEEPDDSPVRLEHRSQYTAMTRYSTTEWVAASDALFLVGQARVLSVRVAAPAGASATWEITPLGDHSGTVPVSTGSGNRFDYTPVVTQAQRSVPEGIPSGPEELGTKVANLPIRYQIKATVVVNGTTHEKVEIIEQDERDIIRQEWVDFRTWRNGFTLHVPYRNRLVTTDREGNVRGNYDLILDSSMTELLEATEANLGAGVYVSSGWRNPQRNLWAGSTVANSNHQHGGAVDMQPVGGPTGAARRRALLDLYNAARGAGGRKVLLERKASQLYPGNDAFPEPTPENPDADGDGLPDAATHGGENLAAMFDRATHVHIDRNPENEAEDD